MKLDNQPKKEWSTMMSRFLGAGIVALMLGVAVLAFSPAGQAVAQSPEEGMEHGEFEMGALTQALAFLRSIPPEQRFQYYRGGTMNFVDQNGNSVTVNMIPGTVTAVASNSVTITPNGQSTGRSFGITGNTWVRGLPPRGSLQTLNEGDQVVVVQEGQSTNAAAIIKHPTVTSQTQPGAAPSPAATPAPSS